MGSISSICSLYVTQETKSNEITKYEEPTPSKSIQTNSQRLSNYQTKNLIFLINDTLIGVNSICSATLYHKMINGETLLQLLDPLNDFDNNKLKEIIVKTSQLFTSDATVFLLKKYKENILILNETIEKKRFLDEKKKEIKMLLIRIILNLTELYHYFKQEISKIKEPYDIFFWETIKKIKNIRGYIEDKINDVNKELKVINQILS